MQCSRAQVAFVFNMTFSPHYLSTKHPKLGVDIDTTPRKTCEWCETWALEAALWGYIRHVIPTCIWVTSILCVWIKCCRGRPWVSWFMNDFATFAHTASEGATFATLLLGVDWSSHGVGMSVLTHVGGRSMLRGQTPSGLIRVAMVVACRREHSTVSDNTRQSKTLETMPMRNKIFLSAHSRSAALAPWCCGKSNLNM